MKRVRRIIIYVILSILLLIGIVFGIYKIFKDENSLTIMEKTWINNNKNSVYTIDVLNDVNVFGKNGNGVFFDFVNDLDEELDLKLNSSVYSINNTLDSFGFGVSTNYDKRDLLIYTDYYVLVSKNNVSVVDLKSIKENTIGVLSKDLNYVSSYYDINSTIKTYENSDELFKALNSDEVSFVIIQENLYKDKIIKDYNINYFFNDAKIYYYLNLGSDKTLNSIVTKYYNTWIKNNFEDSYNKNNYELFKSTLSISDVDIDRVTDKTYNFEYVVSQPYQLISKGKFSGIVNEYLETFNNFSGIDFKYNRVKNFKDLKYDIKNKKVDVFFGNYNYNNNYKNININLPINYYLISNRNSVINIDSLKSYNDVIYVLENSILYDYLSNYSNITIKTYRNVRDLKRLIK